MQCRRPLTREPPASDTALRKGSKPDGDAECLVGCTLQRRRQLAAIIAGALLELVVQDWGDLGVDTTQIVKRAEKIGNEFGVVSDVFKAADGFKFPRQVIGNLANRGVGIETAIPGTAIVVIEAIATRTRVRECSVDK